MATNLVVGDIAIIHHNSNGADSFSFVLLREIEAGTSINFTDNGWQASGGFRSGEGTVTYTAATAIAAGTVITLTGLDLDDAGDQIIAYQGDPATPTILHVIDLADGNNTVAGDATDDNTTALPPGFTLGVNAVAVAFDQSLYAGPTSGSPAELFAVVNNPGNWIDSVSLAVPFASNARPSIDLDADNSTHGGRDYETNVISGGPGVPVADIDIEIDDDDDNDIFEAEIKVNGRDPEDFLAVTGSLPAGIVATAYDPDTGILRLFGRASHSDYAAAILQVRFSTTDSPNNLKRIEVTVSDGERWSPEGLAFIHPVAATDPPVLDLDTDNSNADGADYTATFTSGGPAIPVADVDVSITDTDSAIIRSATITIGINRRPDDILSIAGSLPGVITDSGYDAATGVLTLSGPATLADYQTALRQVVFSTTSPVTDDRVIEVTVNDGTLDSNLATTFMHVTPAPNIAPALDLDANNSTTPGANHLTAFTEGGPAVAIADADVAIVDSDSPTFASATITLTNPQAPDSLTFTGTTPPGVTVAGSGTGIITITGDASAADYQTWLHQIVFSNTSADPSNVTRVIEIVVNDSASDSNTARAFVQVEAVDNEAPRGIRNVVITGMLTNMCCETSARDAMMMDYKVIMVSDANAARFEEDHNVGFTTVYQSFGDVLTTDQVINEVLVDGAREIGETRRARD